MPGKKENITKALLSFQCNEESGFTFFFNKHYASLCLYAFRITKNNEVAEEIAEDAFLKLWERRESFLHPAAIKSYLFTVTKTTSINWLRQLKKENLNALQLAYLSERVEQQDTQIQLGAEIYADVYEAIGKLPPKCQKIFRMHFIEGKDFQQIAHELKLSASTIRNQKARAIMLLRQQFVPNLLSALFFSYLFLDTTKVFVI